MERDREPGEPIQASALATLEARIAELAEPTALLALATEIDDLGHQLAHELTRVATQPALVAPLRPVLLRVPEVRARALLRAAERYDDQGSPRRAAYVLIEALRRAFASETVTTIAEALTFTLDAHGQADAARRVGALITPGADAADRRDQRARFLAALDDLQARITWDALDDELGVD